MSQHRFTLAPGVCAFAILLSACEPRPPRDRGTTGPPLLEPVVPPGYVKVAPIPADTGEEMLSQTATVFRGVVKDVRFTFDHCAGPRTNYVFSDSSPLMGTQVPKEVTVKVLGGPTPGGSWVNVSELPQLALDAEYVTFLRNTDWTFSPVVGDLVFRVETIAGREVLVHPSGRAVTGWSDGGPVLSAALVSEAVGKQRRAYRSADTPPPADQPTSGVPNANGEVSPGDGNAPTPPPAQTEGSPLARAPSPAEIRRAGLFAKPALSAAAIGNEPTLNVESFIGSIRTAADRARVRVGGRLTLDPNWKCWSSTPTARADR